MGLDKAVHGDDFDTQLVDKADAATEAKAVPDPKADSCTAEAEETSNLFGTTTFKFESPLIFATLPPLAWPRMQVNGGEAAVEAVGEGSTATSHSQPNKAVDLSTSSKALLIVPP